MSDVNRYFAHLNYTLGDEDAALDMAVCPSRPDHVVTVAGSGTRIAPLLAREPRRLTVVDVSPVQLAVAELRYATLRALDLANFNRFWGYAGSAEMSATERKAIFDDLSESGSASMRIVRAIFEHQHWRPLLYLGRFERMLAQLSVLNRLFTGRKGGGIFECSELGEQRSYWARAFPRRRWSAILFVLGNSATLNALLYRGSFPKKNRSESSYRIYKNIFERLFRARLARESFFLQMLFFGRLRYPEGRPAECEAAVFNAAKRAAGSSEVVFVQGDLFEAVSSTAKRLDFVSMSDLPSFLASPDDVGVLQRLRPHLAPGALVLTRGHLRLVVPESTGFEEETAAHEEAALAERTQLWTVRVWRKS